LATSAEQAEPRDALSRIVVRFSGVQGFATAAKAELAGFVLSTAKNDLCGGAFSPFNARLKRPCPKVDDETRKRLRAGVAVYDLHEPRKMLALNQGSRIEIGTAERSLAIVTEERALLNPLVECGIEPRTTLLGLRQREEDLAGRIAGARAKLLGVGAALSEIDDTAAATKSRFRAEALADLADATAELASLRPALPALQSLADRAVLRAPVRGIVNRLHRRTLGGSVRPGENMVEIVPVDDRLLVEAYVLPQDIAFLTEGQPVRVKLTAYDFTRYGALDGAILRIGANAVRRDERDEAEVFVVTVQTTGAILDAKGAQVRILPGMTAEVDVLAGTRRVIDYFLQPLERVRASAFRE
jgi:adhesin transport system membrane fusion protein